MGIFKRIKTIAKADINGMLDGMEDPIAMLNEYSREMEAELAKARKALSRQVYIENKLASLIVATQLLVDKRVRQAKLAIEQGDEAITRLAVQEKIIQENQLEQYQIQHEQIRSQTQLLKEKVSELHEKHNEIQQKKVLLASRANVAQSIKRIQQSTSTFQTDTIERGIARAEERILQMEAEIQVGNQFSNPLGQHEHEYLDYVNVETINQEIDKLKGNKDAV